jgi:hypothetical protein
VNKGKPEYGCELHNAVIALPRASKRFDVLPRSSKHFGALRCAYKFHTSNTDEQVNARKRVCSHSSLQFPGVCLPSRVRCRLRVLFTRRAHSSTLNSGLSLIDLYSITTWIAFIRIHPHNYMHCEPSPLLSVLDDVW